MVDNVALGMLVGPERVILKNGFWVCTSLKNIYILNIHAGVPAILNYCQSSAIKSWDYRFIALEVNLISTPTFLLQIG